MKTLTSGDLPAKRIRAKIIKRYVSLAGYDGVVCFSCGNATRELQRAGVDTLAISPKGDLMAGRWFTPHEIRKYWPGRLDATSGHLPVHLMVEIARTFKKHLRRLPSKVGVPTGSGETILCLRWAFPETEFVPVRSMNAATAYNRRAPLNFAVGDKRKAV